MIEAYNQDNVRVQFNPRHVIQTFSGPGFCNVQMTDGTLHRFSHGEAEKVLAAMRTADIR
jgi:hypothetical protein